MNLVPLNDWIIVEEIEQENISPGGIVLPEKKKLLIKRGKVLKISTDIFPKLKKEETELRFNVGDTVLFHSQIGIKIDPSDNEDKRLFMKYESVMGIVE